MGESEKKYKLINTILMATKMIIYSNQNNTFKLLLKQVRFVMKDLFHIERYWTETNDRMAIFLVSWHPIHNRIPVIDMKL